VYFATAVGDGTSTDPARFLTWPVFDVELAKQADSPGMKVLMKSMFSYASAMAGPKKTSKPWCNLMAGLAKFFSLVGWEDLAVEQKPQDGAKVPDAAAAVVDAKGDQEDE
jgi:hypothetical protein